MEPRQIADQTSRPLLDPSGRARRLWSRLRRAHRRGPHPRPGRQGAYHPRESRAPWRLRLRPADRRRRRCAHPHSPRSLRRGSREPRHPPPRAGRVRRRHGVSARGRRRREEGTTHPRASAGGVRPQEPRLARGAGRPTSLRASRARREAGDRSDLRRPARRLARRSGARAQTLPRTQARRARRPRGRRRDRRALLRLQPLVSHHRLQGHADAQPDARLLRRSREPALQERDRARPLALQHQHTADLAPRASVPLSRPQRRDQHRARQHQLDERARAAVRVAALRRGHQEAAADHRAGPERLGRVRQRRRAALPDRPRSPARDLDDDPRGLGEARVDAAGEEGLLPVPRHLDGAVGRSGVDRVLRRARHRRGARPQRPPAVTLSRHQGRPRRDGVRDRRARHPGLRHHPEGATHPGSHVLRRPRRAAHRRRRRDQAHARDQATVRDMAPYAHGSAREPPRRALDHAAHRAAKS